MSAPVFHDLAATTRRWFLGRGALGLGSIALASELGLPGAQPLLRAPRARARNVIYLHMAGSPPTMDMFDPKPLLAKYDGKPCPDSLLKRERFAFIKGTPRMLGTRWPVSQVGDNGMQVIDLLPHLQQVAGELCVVRSMFTDQFNHAPAELLLHTGSPRFGRPSMGSWLSWGIGSENRDLPAYVVLVSGGSQPSAGKSLWGSGFLPAAHQGVQFRSAGEPVLYLQDPAGIDRERRRRSVEAMNDLNRMRLESGLGTSDTEARIAQYELAYRMQASVPEAVDLAAEGEETLALYGAEPGKASFANNCLLARRLVERGVRFVQLFDSGWDIHGTSPGDDLMTQFPRKCGEIDRAFAGLLTDLRRRGLLEDTLVVWGGEFGRTPMNEARNGSTHLGRDHHPHCFTMLLAGAGVRAGSIVGATDDLGYHVTETPIHVHDLQATILHLLGIDHRAFTYRFMGRDFRLTDVGGAVRPELLA